MDTAHNGPSSKRAATGGGGGGAASSISSSSDISSRLELVERQLFARGSDAVATTTRWLGVNDSSRVHQSQMILGYRKRRRNDSDVEADSDWNLRAGAVNQLAVFERELERVNQLVGIVGN